MSLRATWGQAELGALTAAATPSFWPPEAPFLEGATSVRRSPDGTLAAGSPQKLATRPLRLSARLAGCAQGTMPMDCPPRGRRPHSVGSRPLELQVLRRPNVLPGVLT